MYIGDIDGEAIDACITEGKVYRAGKAVNGIALSGDKVSVVTKGTAESDGCAELVWNLSEKKNSERIRRDELEAVYAGHGIAIRYASLTDPYWNAFFMSEADLDAKLSLFDGCGVTAEEKKLFKESVYEKISDVRYIK